MKNWISTCQKLSNHNGQSQKRIHYLLILICLNKESVDKGFFEGNFSKPIKYPHILIVVAFSIVYSGFISSIYFLMIFFEYLPMARMDDIPDSSRGDRINP